MVSKPDIFVLFTRYPPKCCGATLQTCSPVLLNADKRNTRVNQCSRQPASPGKSFIQLRIARSTGIHIRRIGALFFTFRENHVMAKKRKLSPQSVWDTEALTAAFDEAGVKSAHHVLRVQR
jgi:hypothetical protein